MKKGFTLIELLIVIVIIGILAVIVISVAGNSTDRANDAQGKADLHSIQTALEMYHVDNDAYPAALADLTTDYLKAGVAATATGYTAADGCYELEYDLANDNDAQDADDGADDGVFTLTCNQ